MEKRRLIPLIVLALALIGGAVGYLIFSTDPTFRALVLKRFGTASGAAPAGELLASGFIEAEEVTLSASAGGRVADLPYGEGDTVEAGVVVVQLDISLLEAQREAALAVQAIRQAERDRLAAGPREEIIAQAEAQVALAQATVEAAQTTLSALYALQSQPQSVQVQVAEAETQAAVAAQQVAAAQVQLTAAQRSLQLYYDAVNRIAEINTERRANGYPEDQMFSTNLEADNTPRRYEQAEINLNSAEESLQGAVDLLSALQNIAGNPQAIQTQVAGARSRLESVQGALGRAQADLDLARSGARAEDLAVADARIAEAEAGVRAIEAFIDEMTITTPISGVVLNQTVHVGELAVPGGALITIADLSEVELTVYVSQAQLNLVGLDQTVIVSVDSFPGQTFEGTVIRIADEAEFTPRNVQTREERVNLVHAIRIRIPNPADKLKPGMPADALFVRE